MKSSLLNRNSQNGTPAICNAYNTEGWMKSCLPIHWSNSKNPCHRRWSLRRRQCPLFLQCLTLCVESRHNGSHLVNSGRQGQVVDWTLESWKNVLGFHYVFFFPRREIKPWNLCRMFGNCLCFVERWRLLRNYKHLFEVFLWECFIVGLSARIEVGKPWPGWADKGKPDRGEATFPIWEWLEETEGTGVQRRVRTANDLQ